MNPISHPLRTVLDRALRLAGLLTLLLLFFLTTAAPGGGGGGFGGGGGGGFGGGSGGGFDGGFGGYGGRGFSDGVDPGGYIVLLLLAILIGFFLYAIYGPSRGRARSGPRRLAPTEVAPDQAADREPPSRASLVRRPINQPARRMTTATRPRPSLRLRPRSPDRKEPLPEAGRVVHALFLLQRGERCVPALDQLLGRADFGSPQRCVRALAEILSEIEPTNVIAAGL